MEQAVKAFRQAVKLQPENPDAHNNLGLAFLQNGDGNGAIAEFQTATRLRPDDSGYLGNLGAAHLQVADFDAAISEFESAIKLSPEDATLHYDLGLALKLKDKLPEAMAEMRKAAQLDPLQADVHYTLGVTLWQQGEFAAAAAGEARGSGRRIPQGHSIGSSVDASAFSKEIKKTSSEKMGNGCPCRVRMVASKLKNLCAARQVQNLQELPWLLSRELPLRMVSVHPSWKRTAATGVVQGSPAGRRTRRRLACRW